MAQQAWVCEKCFTPYLTESSAITCESGHTIKVEDIKVVAVMYEKHSKIPTTIEVEFVLESMMFGKEKRHEVYKHAK